MMAEKTNSYIICPACDGTGQVRHYIEEPLQPPVLEWITCPRCNGGLEIASGTVDVTDIMDKLQKIKKQTNDIEKLCNDIWDKVK
jgi:DnaJ-class molecular chaperone